MKQTFFFSLLFLILICCHAQNSDNVKVINQSKIETKVDDLIQQYTDLGIYSGVVLIAEKGDAFYHKAFGEANRENNSPNTTKTLFDIGSMNKTFTSIVIKQLVAEEKLKFADKLTDYLDGFQDPNTKRISILHLLEHQSGFGDYHSPDYFEAPDSEKTLAAIVERAKKMDLLFMPGEEQEYSNTGYVLLGAIIEKVSHKSYFQNVRERIVEPLNLKNTYLQNFNDYQDRMAVGYMYSPLGDLESTEEFQDQANPDGGFLATAEDVMHFYRSYFNDYLLLSKEMKAHDPYFQFIESLAPGKAPMEAGGFEGFNTALFHIISDDLTIIVFANMDEPVAEQIAVGILNIARGEKPVIPQLPAIQNIRIQYEQSGISYVKENFETLSANFHPEDPKDIILNTLGYAYLYEKEDMESALELFKLNTELFSQVANCWDSYGEGLLKHGDKSAALDAYQQALELDPHLPSALEAVKLLTKKR